jgi:hypothetical protein
MLTPICYKNCKKVTMPILQLILALSFIFLTNKSVVVRISACHVVLTH